MPVAVADPAPDVARRWPALPAWGVSILLHSLLLGTLGLTLAAPARGPATQPDREVGVVLKRVNEQGEQYFETDSTQPQIAESTDSGGSSASTSPADVVGAQSPVNAESALPQAKPILGLGSNDSSRPTGAGSMTQGSGGSTRGIGQSGKARTSVYGLEGEGFKFVYVFDRSASMGNERFSPLQSAKRELLASLGSLGDIHQFQVIFFNHEPKSFALSGLPLSGPAQRLAFATAPNKEQARRFVEGIIADGGTEYLPALDMALAMAPDVIFFLTDAGTPLSPGQIGQITSRNRNLAVINAIEFGEGPLVGESSLAQLARQNQGRYLYIDISRGLNQP